jgi:hypothetical protein
MLQVYIAEISEFALSTAGDSDSINLYDFTSVSCFALADASSWSLISSSYNVKE